MFLLSFALCYLFFYHCTVIYYFEIESFLSRLWLRSRKDWNDHRGLFYFLVEILTGMGYSKADIEESLKTQKYDDIFATYLLLGRRSSDVSPKLTQKKQNKRERKKKKKLQ